MQISKVAEHFVTRSEGIATAHRGRGRPTETVKPRATAADGDTGTATPEASAGAETGFRSPATTNAFRRLERALLDGLDDEAQTQVREALADVLSEAERLSAEDARPYGRSIEHLIKQLFIHVLKRDPAALAPEEPVVEAPVPDDGAAADPASDGGTPGVDITV